ncbi:hypothetical protein HYALB_00003824 [Hymenoscyphus albidus]|uniref:25S rRNA (uridine-N(3))-methyltransferase BMT5-like domain-containing protein n=1 Tax=Hymenoscyphus albidus TaxID=595503 RepID=A0A9N9QBG3_9HELO|nr:hypothetical protein HYALB_00003824 [Hymenoscyphus albidus]
MGKNKRGLQKTSSKKSKVQHVKNSKPTGISKSLSKTKKITDQPPPSAKKPQQQHIKPPTIPFHPNDSILLIGEGDLSFSASLCTHHSCSKIHATVLESSLEELIAKYPAVGENPGAEQNIKTLGEGGGTIRCGVDVSKKGLGMGKVKERWERIVFNFPHVGGKSKDVNRQVRYNQELLVAFFTNCLPLLSPTPGSSFLITLFEGEPYTLWNIRDLARHSGLEVKRSFRFQAAAYPGYKHARTLGVVKGKDGKVGGGWKGESRSSRTYEFVRKGEGEVQGPGKNKKGDDSSDDEDDATEEEMVDVEEVGDHGGIEDEKDGNASDDYD